MTVSFNTRGKVDSAKANELLNNMLTVAREAPQAVLKYLAKQNVTINELGHPSIYNRLYNALLSKAHFDMYNSDDHPAYRAYGRKIKRFIEWTGKRMSDDYYADGVDDTHWATVQRQVKDAFVSELEDILLHYLAYGNYGDNN